MLSLTFSSSSFGSILFRYTPLTIHWNIAGGLDTAEHDSVILDPPLYIFIKGMTVIFVLLGPSGDKQGINCFRGYCWDSRLFYRLYACIGVFWLELTADSQIHRGADVIADIIRHITLV